MGRLFAAVRLLVTIAYAIDLGVRKLFGKPIQLRFSDFLLVESQVIKIAESR